MIGPQFYDCDFLDLFAGSGQMGIEALSRGAHEAVFVEADKNAFDVVSRNIKKCDFESQARLYREDVFVALRKLQGHRPFDFIFMDPPYDNLLEKRVLEFIKDVDFVSEDTLIIVEASLETDFSYTSDLGFNIIKEKTYKTNKHVFLEKV